MLASFLNLRVKYLRTSVDIQENPQFVQRSSDSFTELLKDDINLWDKLLHKPDEMKDDIEEIAAELENAKGLQRVTQKSKEKELSRKKAEYANAMEKERVILQDFHSLIDIAKQISESTNTQALPTLVYWHDDMGEHCIATNEQILDGVGSDRIP
jgi:chromosome condensin MukBEF complex kleisin-like MukF subunit